MAMTLMLSKFDMHLKTLWQFQTAFGCHTLLTQTGPWATIATAQAIKGTFNWKPHRSLPSRVFVRIENA